MGIAAYNRGSRLIARQLGGYQDPVEPRPRPEGWGDKAMARAVERARRILTANRRLGRNIDVEILAAAVADRARVGEETAQRAAETAMAEGYREHVPAPAPRRRSSVARPARKAAPVRVISAELTPVMPGPPDPRGGYRIEGSVVEFWARKPQAVAAAKALGFRSAAVVKVHTRFQIGYSIQGSNGGLLSKAAYESATRGG